MTTTTDKGKAEVPAEGSLSSGAIIDEMTGFDEQAIKAHFGSTIGAIGDDESPSYDSIMFLRACLFAHYRQTGTGGKTDVDRAKAANEVKFGVLKMMFKPEDGDDDLPGAPGKSDAATT